MPNPTGKPINLALQGGGSHGAFTWGVLDALLERGTLNIEGVSGTSAGAMNAVVLADGFEEGGIDGARQHLEHFWRSVSKASSFSPIQRTLLGMLFGSWSMDKSPGYVMSDIISRFYSPYDYNPLNLNPLREILEDLVDFERVRRCKGMNLFLGATNVFNGKVRVFETPEITADSVMASACLPYMFQAVEIDGIPYWDGGYMGNPVLFPFFRKTLSDDILLVQINPIERRETPKTAREILNRVNEITFNASLLRELRAIEFVSRKLKEGVLSPDEYSDIRMHRIALEDDDSPLSASSKVNAEWKFLTYLRDMGRDAAHEWCDENEQHVGKTSTLRLNEEIAYTMRGELTGF
uniref:patatin-like phospholipase family protein n=1 Tax=Pararhizobium sp. IMCC3301 TaxID=3067904 RepID=UPI0027407A24|nr:patatin-like phospholipase family protein [Pararhizobium sp. IMCC3301]